MKLEICWPDGHHSCFEEKWLQDRIFCQDNVDRFRKLVGRPTPTLWKKEHGPNIQRYDFKDIMENEKTLFHWLVGKYYYYKPSFSNKSFHSSMAFWFSYLGLEVTGLTLIENVTCEKDTLLQLIHRSSGLPKMTHYGQDFEVYSKDDPNNVAYTTSTLGLHLDLPFYEYNPGVTKWNIQVWNQIKNHRKITRFGSKYPTNSLWQSQVDCWGPQMVPSPC